ncbi:hypothetical protein [Streptomyces sp. NPDC002521]
MSLRPRDAIDPDTRLGRRVVVTGYARLVTEPSELACLRGLLAPGVPQQGTDHAVRIRPGLVTGVLLIEGDADPAPAPEGN